MRKFLCVLLSLVMVIGTVPTVFATDTGEQSPLRIDITTDKASYGTYGEAKVTVTVTNTSDQTIENINAEASLEKLTRTSGNTQGSKQSLASGESFKFDYKVMLGDSSNLNFFQKIWHWIVKIFRTMFSGKNGGSTIDKSRDFVQETKSIKFGKVTGTNTVKVWFEENSMDFTNDELSDMQNVDKAIATLMDSEEFTASDTSTRKNKMEEQLQKFLNEGLIIEPILYDDETLVFSFKYKSGALGGVSLNDFNDIYNGVPHNDDVRSNTTLTTKIQPTNTSLSSNIGEAIILNAFENTDYRRNYYPTVQSEWNNKGLDTKIDTDVTVTDIKNLASYEVIVFSGHGSTHNQLPVWVLNETADSTTDKTYSKDINEERIVKWNGVTYAIYPSLITTSYSATAFDNSFIFSESCQFMGNNNNLDESMPNAFLSRSVKAVVGFCNSVYATYSREFMKTYVDNLIDGESAISSYNNSITTWGANDVQWYQRTKGDGNEHSLTAFPCFRGNENATFIKRAGKVTGTVKDSTTQAPLSGVTVKAVGTSYQTQTDNNGFFKLFLPQEMYGIQFSKYGYATVDKNVIIVKDGTLSLEDITMTPFTTKPMVLAGSRYTLAIKADGSLWGWGENDCGQLGDGTTIDKHLPIRIGMDTDWASVASEGSYTIAIKRDGSLWAWGVGGQLGDGTTNSKHSPVQIGTDTDWTSIATGGSHAVAIKKDGSLWAWGQNTYGQLGNGTTTRSFLPLQIGIDTDWANVATGWYHTVAIKTDGSLWAWGRNSTGQLGDDTRIDRHSPVQVSTNTNWASVSAGDNTTRGIKTDGSLWVWRNPTIRQYGSATDWIGVTMGASHWVAIRADGSLWASESNSNGQLGDGTTTFRGGLVQVLGENGVGYFNLW